MYITNGKVFGGTQNILIFRLFLDSFSISEHTNDSALRIHTENLYNYDSIKKHYFIWFSPYTKFKLPIGFNYIITQHFSLLMKINNLDIHTSTNIQQFKYSQQKKKYKKNGSSYSSVLTQLIILERTHLWHLAYRIPSWLCLQVSSEQLTHEQFIQGPLKMNL